ncbi:MAG TPA: hypothetical protein VJ044_14845 [Candidatus Hodarchaeales archaeon]|nr:hypothetical protein [Candidatus Hodarchaeales archaeon]
MTKFSASKPATNRSLEQFIANLNEAQVEYSGTDMRLVYEIRGGSGGQGNPEGVIISSQK